jgi:hypothetical protein
VVHSGFFQPCHQRIGTLGFAVNEECFSDAARRGLRVLHQHILPGMRRKTADGRDLAAYIEDLPENLDAFFPIRQAPAKRVGCLPRDDQDRVARIFYIVSQVMQNATGFGGG